VPHQWPACSRRGWINASGAWRAGPSRRYKLGNAQRDKLLAEFKDLGGVGVEVVDGSTPCANTPTGASCAALRAAGIGGIRFSRPGESYRDLGNLLRCRRCTRCGAYLK